MMKRIAYVNELYVDRLKIKSIHIIEMMWIVFVLNKDDMEVCMKGLQKLVKLSVGNDVDTIHKEIDHLVGISFLGVYRYR